MQGGGITEGRNGGWRERGASTSHSKQKEQEVEEKRKEKGVSRGMKHWAGRMLYLLIRSFV